MPRLPIVGDDDGVWGGYLNTFLSVSLDNTNVDEGQRGKLIPAAVDEAGAVMNSDTSTTSMSFVVDEDAMTSDSATKVPTQQSVKAYVDTNAGDPTDATSVASAGAYMKATDDASDVAYDDTTLSALGVTGDDVQEIVDNFGVTMGGIVTSLNDTKIGYADTSTADMDFVVDEDNMASDSATKIPTQQSVKAYTDNAVGDSYTNSALPDIGSVGTKLRTKIPQTWFDSLKATAGIRYVVVMGDSFGVWGDTAFPWILEKGLLGLTNTKTSEPQGWRFASGNGIVPRWNTMGGATNVGTTSTYGATLTAGQKGTVIATCDGITVFYRTSPGAGSLIVRDGVGGTTLTTINTNAATGMGSWTSNELSLASRTFEFEATGGTVVVDGSYQTSGNLTNGIRVISASRSGATSKTMVDTPSHALDLVNYINSTGELALLIPATGTNDNITVGWQGQLIDALKAATPSVPIVSWIPPINQVNPKSEYEAMRADILTRDVELIDGTLLGRIDGSDNVHPTPEGSTLIGSQIAKVLSGDPIGYERNDKEKYVTKYGNSTVTGDLTVATGSTGGGNIRAGHFHAGSSYSFDNGTAIASNPVGTIIIGSSPLNILLGVYDGTIKSRYFHMSEAASDPSAPAANNAIMYPIDDGSGNTEMRVRYSSGSAQKLVTNENTVTMTNKTLTSPVLNTGVSGTAIDTDTSLTANSDTKLASQKAVKAYTDNSVAGAVMESNASTESMSFVVDEDDMVSDTATKVPTQQSVKAYVDSTVGDKASDADVVKLTGDQTVAGLKTFTNNTTFDYGTNGMLQTGHLFGFPSLSFYNNTTDTYPALSIVGSIIGFGPGGSTDQDIALGHLGANNLGVNADFEINTNTRGVILRSPNDTRFRLTVDDDGSLITTAI